MIGKTFIAVTVGEYAYCFEIINYPVIVLLTVPYGCRKGGKLAADSAVF